MKRIAVALAAFLLSVPNVDAKTLYVDAAAGNDTTTYTANGPTAPWRSIGRAAWGSTSRSTANPNEAARAGDVVIVRQGTYDTTGTGQRYDPAYNPVNSGTAGNPITFRAEGRVTLTMLSGSGPVIGTVGRSYIVWDGFYIDEAQVNTRGDTGVAVVWSSQHVTMQNLEIRSKFADYTGDNHTGIRIENSQYTVIRGNLIYNVGSAGNIRGQNDAGVQLYNADDSIIEYNDIHSCGTGIFVKGNAGVGGNERTIIRYNLIYNMGLNAAGRGIALNYSESARVYQNIVRDSAGGIVFIDLETNGTPVNDIVANNTLHSLDTGVEFRGTAAGWRNLRIFNNVITATRFIVGSEPFTSPGDAAFEHNVYNGFSTFAELRYIAYSFDNWKTQFNKDRVAPLSTTLNPLYVNAAQNDLRICRAVGTPSSSCIGPSPVLQLGVDILDLNRNGSTTDLIPAGAYVTGSEVIGRGGDGAIPSTPSAPTNLRVIP